MNILIVEDSTMTRSLIRSVVEGLDSVDTHEASSGFAALKMLPERKYDLIITDINMPDINGLELLNYVKNDAKYSDTPILIISTESSAEDRDRGMKAGASAYLTKPFKPEELLSMIKGLIH